MIYNKDFIWLHFPKCAGTKVATLFSRYFSKTEGLFQDPVGVKANPSIGWHDAVSERMKREAGFDPGERTIVTSFRRLLPWLISRYNFEARRSPKLEHSPDLLLEGKFLEADGNVSHADFYIQKYLPDDILKSGRVKFIRAEYLEKDFRSVFGAYLDITVVPDRAFRKKINTTENYILSETIAFLQLKNQTIYDNCPCWKAVEKMAYGHCDD